MEGGLESVTNIWCAKVWFPFNRKGVTEKHKHMVISNFHMMEFSSKGTETEIDLKHNSRNLFVPIIRKIINRHYNYFIKVPLEPYISF